MASSGPDLALGIFRRWRGVVFLAAVLAAALIFGGWQAGWWLKAQNVNRQAQLSQNSYGAQVGYIQAITDDVATIDTYLPQENGVNGAAARAEVIGVGNQACLEASYLTGTVRPSAEMQDWINANCSGGAVSPDSPLRHGEN